MMKRFKFSEIDTNRIKSAIHRRLRDVPHMMSWVLSSDARRNREKLRSLKDIHKGERCFIIGNGPSLSKMDLSILSSETTFGTNRIYLLFDRTEFRPTYYVSVNELVLSQFVNEIINLPMPKFLNWNLRHLYGFRDDIYYFRLGLGLWDRFEPEIVHPLSGGGTVTFVAMQIAYFMGFSKVILIGVDHNFIDKGIPNKEEERQSEIDANHFHPNYFPKGIKWQLPDLTRSEIAYRMARESFEKSGREILDATINGNCQVFKKVDWYSLF